MYKLFNYPIQLFSRGGLCYQGIAWKFAQGADAANGSKRAWTIFQSQAMGFNCCGFCWTFTAWGATANGLPCRCFASGWFTGRMAQVSSFASHSPYILEAGLRFAYECVWDCQWLRMYQCSAETEVSANLVTCKITSISQFFFWRLSAWPMRTCSEGATSHQALLDTTSALSQVQVFLMSQSFLCKHVDFKYQVFVHAFGRIAEEYHFFWLHRLLLPLTGKGTTLCPQVEHTVWKAKCICSSQEVSQVVD